MVIVKKMPGESDDSLIRRFSRMVLSEGVIQEAKNAMVHLKPSLARKRKQEERRRLRKALAY